MNEKKRVEIGGKREKRTTAKVFLDSELPFQWNGSCLFTGKKQYGDQKSHHCFYFSFFARASALISLSFAARPLHVLSISWLKRKLRDFSQSMKVKAVKQPGLYRQHIWSFSLHEYKAVDSPVESFMLHGTWFIDAAISWACSSPHAHCSSEKISVLVKHCVDVDWDTNPLRSTYPPHLKATIFLL